MNRVQRGLFQWFGYWFGFWGHERNPHYSNGLSGVSIPFNRTGTRGNLRAKMILYSKIAGLVLRHLFLRSGGADLSWREVGKAADFFEEAIGSVMAAGERQTGE